MHTLSDLLNEAEAVLYRIWASAEKLPAAARQELAALHARFSHHNAAVKAEIASGDGTPAAEIEAHTTVVAATQMAPVSPPEGIWRQELLSVIASINLDSAHGQHPVINRKRGTENGVIAGLQLSGGTLGFEYMFLDPHTGLLIDGPMTLGPVAGSELTTFLSSPLVATEVDLYSAPPTQ